MQFCREGRPIERGHPGPGLLAHVLVSKYADHCPLYRQSQIYGRERIGLERSTLADWVGQSAALLEPLADAIGRHVQAGRAIFADNTPIKMQAMSAPGAVLIRPLHGISSQQTAKASIPQRIWPATRAGCMRTAIPASMSCTGPAQSASLAHVGSGTNLGS